MTEIRNKYDLEERTAKLGEDIIDFCKSIRQDVISKPIISQLIRAGTSIGANYMEANAASSKKDFRNKIHICKKESQETKHWLRMMAKIFPERISRTNFNIWQDFINFEMIFSKFKNSNLIRNLNFKIKN